MFPSPRMGQGAYPPRPEVWVASRQAGELLLLGVGWRWYDQALYYNIYGINEDDGDDDVDDNEEGV